ncbi:MAG: hypothetical protein ACI9UO_001692 [Nitrospinales bacterium]|jgi:hypothetical protein
MGKKRNHYIPIAYLNNFCNEDGGIQVYLKDYPDKSIPPQIPKDIGFEKYYYSQPLPDGERDNNTLEDLFCELEGKWPPIIEQICHQENTQINDRLEDIFAFMALQRARVPASRDVSEKMLAETVKATLRQLDASGKLPPKPKGYENMLDHLDVSIDPHKSMSYGDIWCMRNEEAASPLL